MKLLFTGAIALTAACSQADQPAPSPSGTAATPHRQSDDGPFRPLETLRELRSGYDTAAVAILPIPVHRNGGLYLAVMLRPAYVIQPSTPEERRKVNEVYAPAFIAYVDPRTGERHFFDPVTGVPTLSAVEFGLKAECEKYFGLTIPQGGVVGSYGDPTRLLADRIEILRERVLSALDILLPIFADQRRPWTEAANTAARELRDFFPLAAEPGHWPYYKAEGKEFFAWVEKNAPPEKAVMPWETPPAKTAGSAPENP